MSRTKRRVTRGGLDIPESKLAAIIDLARTVEAGHPGDRASREGEAAPQLAFVAATRAADRLKTLVGRLSDDEQAVLLALTSIGRGDFTPAQFDAALTSAFERRCRLTADYVASQQGLSELLERGVAACGDHRGSSNTQA